VKTKLLLLLAALMVLASPMFAQGGASAKAADNHYWIWIASGFSMAFASGLCGLAQSRAVAAACEGMGRNPGASAGIRLALILGLAFIESLALFTFAVVFAKIVP
jgi:F-type H+-transporting ATPase subunit c